MNSFKRFETVINHKKPDKIPFYFPSIACTVASEILGREIDSGADSLHFKKGLAWLDGENGHDDFVCKYRENAIELNRKLKADVVRETWRYTKRPTKKLDDYNLLFGEEEGRHIINRFFPKTQAYGTVEDTTGPRDVEELKRMLKEEMTKDYRLSDSELDEIYKDQLKFKKAAEPYFPTIFGGLSMVIPMYNTVWLEATLLETNLLCDYFMYKAESAMHQVKWISKKGFKWINGGGDIASNTGPIYSPETFEKIMVKPLRKIADECNKYEINYCYRTDGNIWSIFNLMFKMTGVQAFGEVDREAGMTVGKIKEKSPRLLILGNNSSSKLNSGTVNQVREETKAGLIESEGYNFIAGPSNAVLHGTPVENVYAMIDEIEKFKP